MPEKIPIEENKEFKSIRNAVVKCASEIFSPSEQPEREIDYDYAEMKDRKNDFDYLSFRAEIFDDPMTFYRLGRYYLEKTDDTENAEWWLRKAADGGIAVASYLVYKSYRDGKFTEKPSDKLRYLRKAVDAGFGYAEYEYAKHLMDKSPETAKEYLVRAALTVASKRNIPTEKCSSMKVSARKRRNGLSVPRARMRGHRRESGFYSITNMRMKRPGRLFFPLPTSRAMSLRRKRFKQSNKI